jgi:hypothetical protein
VCHGLLFLSQIKINFTCCQVKLKNI